MKTYQPKAKEIKREWHLFDADGEVLGRLATKIAILLTGKNKTVYSTHMDMGDFVVVINAEKVELTGKKKLQKTYKSHSGYPGGFKEVAFLKMLKENPKKIIEKAVSGMLPDNRLKDKRLLRLKVYKGEENPYKDKFKLEN
ncbi:MAG TPA: 50S ribosomal protein L13 [Patescibacteria group bacterium]|nr:50S ribosomal protein L13 [Patescibacteria group bacterium]